MLIFDFRGVMVNVPAYLSYETSRCLLRRSFEAWKSLRSFRDEMKPNVKALNRELTLVNRLICHLERSDVVPYRLSASGQKGAHRAGLFDGVKNGCYKVWIFWNDTIAVQDEAVRFQASESRCCCDTTPLVWNA